VKYYSEKKFILIPFLLQTLVSLYRWKAFYVFLRLMTINFLCSSIMFNITLDKVLNLLLFTVK